MTERPMPLPIVVGVDGSKFSERALDWAIDEASRRGRPLWLICAWAMDYTAGMIGRLIPFIRDGCDRVLADARQRVTSRAPTLTVTTQTIQGQPAAALTDASARAFLVVVGSRGLGSFHGALAGSTSMAVAAHAHCPVVVIHEQSPPTGPARRVIVGVDGSAASADTLRYAFDQASERGLGLTAVHAWGVTFIEGTFVVAGLIDNLEALSHEQEAMTAEWINPWREKFPNVDVQMKVTQARPVDALVDASQEAQLLVVGSRGHGGFTHLLLGSVSQGVLHRAHCPVAVIRARVVQQR